MMIPSTGERLPARRIRRLLMILAAVAFLLLLALWGIPRIVPWEGQSALDEMTWSLQVQDREGRLLQVRPVNDDGLRRVYLPREELPGNLVRIVRRSEDRRFFFHPGFDVFSLLRAGFHYARGEDYSGGGSTISMQLARILHPRPAGTELTVAMKLRETFEALQLESRYSKREILELYINLIPFGRNIEGYPAAAQLYFGKDLALLLPEEICILTVIPRSPALYDPFTSPDANRAAAGRLASEVLSNGDSDPLIEGAFRGLPAGPASWPFEAPHFVAQVLTRRENWPSDRHSGRLPIRTTLDLDLQKEAGSLLAFNVELAGDFRISNGAMLLADPETMEILAYLGSADFYNKEDSGQIDGVMMLREPGSTLKPLLYGTALDLGWTAATILPDIPMEFGDRFIYTPMNYDQQYHGPVRLRQALAASLNIPAVYTLERLGVERFIDALLDAGFQSLESQREGLGVSLAIGGAEVSLAELVQGFGAMYAGGTVRPLKYLDDDPSAGTRVWSLESADIITDIMSSSDDRVMTFGRTGPVRFDYPAAIKTGTSNQFNNIWAVGFTSDMIGAVWMGNFDGSTVIAAPGSSLPATVLHEAFDRWSEKGEIHRHSDLETRRICSISGMEATDACPYTMDEVFAWGTAPGSCDWHRRNNRNGRTTLQYPSDYSHWAERYGYTLEFSDTMPAGIAYPVEGAVYFMDSGAPGGVGEIRISLVGAGPGRLIADGRQIYDGPLPADIHWKMKPGVITFVLEQNETRVSRRIEVR